MESSGSAWFGVPTPSSYFGPMHTLWAILIVALAHQGMYRLVLTYHGFRAVLGPVSMLRHQGLLAFSIIGDASTWAARAASLGE
eukprot:5430798-Amphidinium_carterae.1